MATSKNEAQLTVCNVTFINGLINIKGQVGCLRCVNNFFTIDACFRNPSKHIQCLSFSNGSQPRSGLVRQLVYAPSG
jgi:hypothetical protein